MARIKTLLSVLALWACAQGAWAADHLDGPRASADPAADITDVFAWMSADASKVYLAMGVSPKATTASKFSDMVQYVWHTTSSDGYGKAGTSVDVVCTFDAAQKISCWAGDEYVTGDASNPAGITSTSGKLKVFAGLRDDPFFFSLDSFNAVAKTVAGAAASLKFDGSGCPALDSATSTALVTGLKTAADGKGGPAVDFFTKLNALYIVISVDKTVILKNTVMSVWGSTNKAQ